MMLTIAPRIILRSVTSALHNSNNNNNDNNTNNIQINNNQYIRYCMNMVNKWIGRSEQIIELL